MTNSETNSFFIIMFFYNKYEEKNREIKIDSSNGIDVLAYPAPEYNVGFSLNGKSRNPGAGRFKNKPKKK